jgi:hypothetical protein
MVVLAACAIALVVVLVSVLTRNEEAIDERTAMMRSNNPRLEDVLEERWHAESEPVAVVVSCIDAEPRSDDGEETQRRGAATRRYVDGLATRRAAEIRQLLPMARTADAAAPGFRRKLKHSLIGIETLRLQRESSPESEGRRLAAFQDLEDQALETIAEMTRISRPSKV